MQKKTKLLIAFLAILLALPATTQAQMTVEEILKNSFENTGGIDNWKALEAMKMTGTATFNGGAMQADLVMYRKAPQFERMEMQIQGKTFIQAFDGEMGWMVNPFMGSEEPQAMTEDDMKDMKDRYFEDEFIDWQSKGHTVELQPLEAGDPENTYRLKLTKNNGDVEYHFFDVEYFVPVLVRTFSKVPQAEGVVIETKLSDYLPVEGTINGQAVTLYVPHSIENDGFSIKIPEGSIEINPTVEDEFFKMSSQK